MKLDSSKVKATKYSFFTGLLFAFVFFVAAPSAFGQGNTISGHVFGNERRPVADVDVELLDDYSRTIQRVRTNSSGRFYFHRLPAGRFKIRVLPFATDYEQQEQDIEIVNFARVTGTGDTRISGTTNEQRDIYLRPRRGANPTGAAEAVFVQEVPPEAKKLYDAAVDDLKDKRTKEAYTALKSSLEIFPTYFAALELLGTEYMKAGHFEAAQILLSIATQVNARSYRSWHSLAYSLFSLKRYPDAIVAIGKALEISAVAPEAMLLNGVLLRRTMKYEEAEKQLTKAKELYGEAMPEFRRELGLVYADRKRYKEAIKELKAYLKARPEAKDVPDIKRMLTEIEGLAG